MQKNAKFALIDAKYKLKMNLQQIKYFLALADELHFWKTSEKVFITQSALSRQIKSLEYELGFSLFERDKRNVKLTAAGEFLQTEFRKILIDFESVTRRAKQISDGEIGTLRIGHPASITFSVLPKILNELAEKHPHILVQMFEVDAIDVDSSLLTHRIDLAFNREVTKSKELESKMLMTENFALVVSANHPINQQSEIDLRKLKDEWFVLPSLNGQSEHAAQLRAIFTEAEFSPKVRFESDFGATLLGLVAKGLGISIMPFSYSHYLTEEIRFIKIPANSSLYTTWRFNEKNAVMENFLKVVEKFAEK
ncbi:MAG TPA: LysR family transcriptional regulator [Pyrinomonadaceae bacterium]|nr:LysR family transcriptional regulator [Pyrinomonadaceae bacterium]